MLNRQADKLRTKLLLQASRVWSKVKPLRSKEDKKEVTNQEVQLLLYQYFTSSDTKNEYSEWQHERLNDAMVNLSVEQMEVIKRRFEQAQSYAIIGNYMGHLQDPKWAYRVEKDALEVLRKAFEKKG